MKKTTKKILTGLIIVIGLVFLSAGYLGVRFYLATRNLSPSATCQINDSVFCIKDSFANAYLFRGDSGYLLIDAGIDEERFKTELAKLKIRPSEIRYIVLTHTDNDHIAAMGIFNPRKIYLHKDEEQMVNGQNGKLPLVRVKWKYAPYTLFNSDDTLRLNGIPLRVYHTPGHTPGSCCFLAGRDYLITGDNVIFREGKYGPLDDIFNMDTKLQERSIQKLPAPSTVKYLLTSHHGVIRID